MRSETARRLVEEALREGYTLSAEALQLLESSPNPIEVLRAALRYLKTHEPDAVLLEERHIEAAGLKKEKRVEEASSEAVLDESEPEELGWTPRIEIDEKFTRVYRIRGETQEFEKYFQSRYSILRSILEQRGESFSQASEALRLQRGRELLLALMLLEKRETSKANILVAEDPTATLKIIVPKSSRELSARVEWLPPDQVFGVRVRKLDGGTLIAEELMLPDIPMKSKPDLEEGPEVYLCLISDLHVGSKKFRRDLWERFLDWINRPRDREVKRVRYLVLAGDLVDGVGVFPKQERELEYTSIEKQFEEAARTLSEIPGRVTLIYSPGNHEPIQRALPQPPLTEKYKRILNKAREIIYVGNPAWIKIENKVLLIYHGQSLDDLIQALPNTSYKTLSQDIKRVLEVILKSRHLAPIYGDNTPVLPLRQDLLAVTDIPDIIHTGHVHVAYAGKYRGINLVNTGTWQEQTDYQRSLGLQPTVGTMALINLKTMEMKLRRFM